MEKLQKVKMQRFIDQIKYKSNIKSSNDNVTKESEMEGNNYMKTTAFKQLQMNKNNSSKHLNHISRVKTSINNPNDSNICPLDSEKLRSNKSTNKCITAKPKSLIAMGMFSKNKFKLYDYLQHFIIPTLSLAFKKNDTLYII